jgi:hypothetical protein
MSGNPVVSSAMVRAAVVINPPRSRAIPEPESSVCGYGWGRFLRLAESAGWQKPAAQSKFRRFFIEIGVGRDFWKAALRKALHFAANSRFESPWQRFPWRALSAPP